MTTITAQKARTTFADVLAKTDYTKERFVITKHGRPAAALIPIEEYELLQQVLEKLEYDADVRAGKDALAEIKELGGIEACCVAAEEFFAQLEKERATK
jgi:prevent-host-death family protein